MIQNKKGFTLIELIIVMAIIGILAVVAVIAIGSKSADARDARRLADANTIRFAFSLHAIDHGDDYLEGPAAAKSILLNELINRGDLNYLTLDNTMDPDSSRTDTCYSGIGTYRCDREGGYTLFDMLTSDDAHMGTFSNYGIGIKLESDETIARLESDKTFVRIDWRKFVGIETVYAGTCPNGICEIDEDFDSCPQDCLCGNGFCDMMDMESFMNCPVDCASPADCGDGTCDLFGGESLFNCAEDCAEPVEEDSDTNDYLYIDQDGVHRMTGGNPDAGGGGEGPPIGS